MIVTTSTQFTREDGLTLFEEKRLDIGELGILGASPTQIGRSYFAICVITLNTTQGPMQDQFRVEIPAGNLLEAFENLPALLKEAPELRVKELQAQQRAASRQIVLPSGQTLPPAGRPNTKVA